MVKSWISLVSNKLMFSYDSVVKLIELYGFFRARNILHSLKSPGDKYFLRVNTLKACREDVLEKLAEEGVEAYVYPNLTDVIYLKVEGPFEVKMLNKKVVAKKDAAESVYMGANLYAPGVERADKVKAGDRVTIVDPYNRPVGEGIAEMDWDEILYSHKGLAVRTVKSIYKVPSVRELKAYKEGLIYDQSLPSITASHVLAPKEGWKIVDMCASPGGKATHVAQLTRDKGEVLAVDRSESKINKIRENIERLGTKSIKTFVRDSRYLDLEDVFNEADAVILDPPCSSLGVRPKLSYERDLRDVHSLSRYQGQFLRVASRIVKKEGLILYSTCTMTLEENELNIWWAYKFCKLKPVSQKVFFGSPGFNVGSLEGYVFQRFEPDIHHTPGFFISLLVKK